jgi:hypothetical protein
MRWRHCPTCGRGCRAGSRNHADLVLVLDGAGGGRQCRRLPAQSAPATDTSKSHRVTYTKTTPRDLPAFDLSQLKDGQDRLLTDSLSACSICGDHVRVNLHRYRSPSPRIVGTSDRDHDGITDE